MKYSYQMMMLPFSEYELNRNLHLLNSNPKFGIHFSLAFLWKTYIHSLSSCCSSSSSWNESLLNAADFFFESLLFLSAEGF